MYNLRVVNGGAMRNSYCAFYIWIALLTFLVACAPQTTALPTPSIVPSLVPVALAGPEMKVGSTASYVDGSLLVAVPAGAFTMGGDGLDNPLHTVTLSDFWIYTTKVTNQQYALCVQAGNCSAPDTKDSPLYTNPGLAANPVVGVTYDQAAAYCTYVHARLPTEAEWEKAARGPSGNIYPWGDAAPSCDRLNFNDCLGRTTNVTTYQMGQSFYHALDMEGNAFEWVADWYDSSYYKTSPAQNPTGPDTGQSRSVRSSGFESKANSIPAATRFSDFPVRHRNDLSFRCVVEDPTYFAHFCQMVMINGLNAPPPPENTCPKLSINSQPVCIGGKYPGDIISVQPYPLPVNGPSSIDQPSPDCQILSVNKWFCPLSTAKGFRVWHVCTIDLSGGTCVPGYHPGSDPQTCIPDAGTVGTSTTCIAGYNYDPAKQCCSAIPGTGTPYSPCPPGSVYSGNICALLTDFTLTQVIPGVCNIKPTPGGNQSACEPQSCGFPMQWDPNKCICVNPSP
jgi:formylglycine-generating enzyme